MYPGCSKRQQQSAVCRAFLFWSTCFICGGTVLNQYWSFGGDLNDAFDDSISIILIRRIYDPRQRWNAGYRCTDGDNRDCVSTVTIRRAGERILPEAELLASVIKLTWPCPEPPDVRKWAMSPKLMAVSRVWRPFLRLNDPSLTVLQASIFRHPIFRPWVLDKNSSHSQLPNISYSAFFLDSTTFTCCSSSQPEYMITLTDIS